MVPSKVAMRYVNMISRKQSQNLVRLVSMRKVGLGGSSSGKSSAPSAGAAAEGMIVVDDELEDEGLERLASASWPLSRSRGVRSSTESRRPASRSDSSWPLEEVIRDDFTRVIVIPWKFEMLDGLTSNSGFAQGCV